MNIFSWRSFLLLLGGLLAGLIMTAVILPNVPAKWKRASTWQQMSRPGPLSAAHAFLKNDCAACHTPTKGVQGIHCITCHANDTALFQRQPSAFHADITTCSPCHLEHQGGQRPTKMDHAALASIGLVRLQQDNPSDPKSRQIRQYLTANNLAAKNPNITPLEATLNCANCHATKDRHRNFFGSDCASCHAVTKWAIPEYRHPSPNSRDCVQCHLAPPSHYMMHFKMVSMSVAKQPGATVDQCYKCHQTTVWNDIRGVGWYKHH